MRLLKYPQFGIFGGWCPSIADLMGLKRLIYQKNVFILNDSTNKPKKGTPEFDVLCKGRPIGHSLLERSRSIQQQECVN